MSPERTLISVSQSEEERFTNFTQFLELEKKEGASNVSMVNYFAVLEAVACGFKNREIATLLNVSLPSNRYCLRRLYRIFDIDAPLMEKRRVLIEKAVELDILPQADLAIFDEPILSDREVEVVELIARGFSNQEIAMELDEKPNSLSAHTVKSHIYKISGKLEKELGYRPSRTEIAINAISREIIGVDKLKKEYDIHDISQVGSFIKIYFSLASLSPRQREVFDGIAAGFSYRETSKLLDISYNTIKSHMTEVYKKLKSLGIDLENRTQLAVFWFLAENAIDKWTQFLKIRELLISLLYAKCEEEGIIVEK